MSRVPAR
jgi:hypothetical protein